MKNKFTITKSQARRFLLLKHGLLGEHKFRGKQGIVDYVKQAGCIQYDPIDVCGKNHELNLFSKVKDFSKGEMYSLLYEDRVLIDCLDKCMSICLTSDWPYFADKRKATDQNTRSKEEIDSVASYILEYIKENGPICSSDINFGKKVDWHWSDTSLSRAALDRLFFRGDLVFHHKKNTRKYYDLAQKHIDSKILNQENPNKTLDETLRWNVMRRISSVGMLHNNASYAFISVNDLKTENRNRTYMSLIDDGSLTEVWVEESKKSFYFNTEDYPIMDVALSNENFGERIEFLAPLDNMMWDRKIIKELFDFDYKWEIYTPAKDRVFGYYVLPVLHGEKMIGRIELKRDKKEGRIKIVQTWIGNDTDSHLIKLIEQKAAQLSDALYA